MSVRRHQLTPVMLVLGLTVGGFFVSRAHVSGAAALLPWIVLAGGLG